MSVGDRSPVLILSLGFGFLYPKLTQLIIDDVIRGQHYNWLMPASLGLIGAFLFRELFNSLRIRINNRLEQNVIFDMRREVYARLQRLPVPWFDQRASGDLMTRVIEDVNNVERLLIDGVEQGTVALLSIVGARSCSRKFPVRVLRRWRRCRWFRCHS